jgi:uncharacterized protein (DUF427 family)
VSLTTGRGPLSGRPAGHFSQPVPGGVVYVEPFPRRVRGYLGSSCVIDSDRVVLVHRPGRPPSYAFPPGDVHGAAVGEPASEPDPDAPDHVRVDWDAVDAWYEEDQRVFGHPRNPYHRVECVPTHRRLRVEVAGLVIVDSDRTMGVYETALEPRLYVNKGEVRDDVLLRSDTSTYCPYKGNAIYWSAVVDGAIVADVAWSYEEPLPESLPIKGMLSFDERRVELTHDLPSTS